MKKAVVALLMVTSINAFAGYTAEVCQTNEAGEKVSCRMVYFKRDLGQTPAPQGQLTCSGEAQDTVCDKSGAHVPTLLIKINKFFEDRGFTPRQDDSDYVGG